VDYNTNSTKKDITSYNLKMSKNNDKKLKAKVEALKSQLGPREKLVEKKENLNINLEIKKDIVKTLILIFASFGILFLIKYLDTNFFFNKFF
jgi:hypothetical protein